MIRLSKLVPLAFVACAGKDSYDTGDTAYYDSDAPAVVEDGGEGCHFVTGPGQDSNVQLGMTLGAWSNRVADILADEPTTVTVVSFEAGESCDIESTIHGAEDYLSLDIKPGQWNVTVRYPEAVYAAYPDGYTDSASGEVFSAGTLGCFGYDAPTGNDMRVYDYGFNGSYLQSNPDHACYFTFSL